jgi:hypothetical protein
MSDDLLRRVLIAIAAITVLTGLAQLVVPSTVLGVVATSAEPSAAHMFATVGMFMVITGAMFLQSLLARSREPAIPLWIGVQKAAACVLVALGVVKGVFAMLALGVAAFDGLTGVLAFMFWQRLPR